MAPAHTIGLTGEVGAGKSTILEWLTRRGSAGLDADAVVHRLLDTDVAVVEAIVRRFGAEVRGGTGVDRGRLAELAFADPAALADLEGIVHPAALREVRAWLAVQSAEIAVVEAAKLVESGFHHELGRLWLVTCARQVRRERLVARGWSEREIDRRMASTPPLGPRLALADAVIDNTGSWEATERQLETALARIRPSRRPNV